METTPINEPSEDLPREVVEESAAEPETIDDPE